MSSKTALLLSFALAVNASEPRLELFEAVEPHMGTLVGIKLYAGDEKQAATAFRAAFDRIAELDSILSDYRPDSELNRLCRTAARHKVGVSSDLFRVLAASQSLAERSGGAFDVTIGPVIRVWREARRQRQLPAPEKLTEALSHCGYRKMHLDPEARTVVLDEDGMQLDLGGIAKGYAADEALAGLKHLGVSSALVAMSGDLVFSGAPPGHSGWRIVIGATGRVAELVDAAVSTSGDSEQHLDVDGRRYSHIVDPATGSALTNRLTVSVVASSGTIADGLATTICVLGEQAGTRLASEYGVRSIYVRQD